MSYSTRKELIDQAEDLARKQRGRARHLRRLAGYMDAARRIRGRLRPLTAEQRAVKAARNDRRGRKPKGPES